MRGKTARRLRRLAITRLPQGSPIVRYLPLKPSTVFGSLIPGSATQKMTTQFLGQVVMRKDCVRHVYQGFKGRFKAAMHEHRVFPPEAGK